MTHLFDVKLVTNYPDFKFFILIALSWKQLAKLPILEILKELMVSECRHKVFNISLGYISYFHCKITRTTLSIIIFLIVKSIYAIFISLLNGSKLFIF